MHPRGPSSQSAPSTVIVIGPSPDEMGGMASVVEQMLGMDFDGRYQTELLPVTRASNESERFRVRIGRHLGQLRRFRSVIRRTRAALVHIHTCSGFSFYRSLLDMVTAQRLGCRVILHVHGAKFDSFYASEPRWRRRLIAWALTRADRVIALSGGWRDRLREMAPRARLVVVENAVDVPGMGSETLEHSAFWCSRARVAAGPCAGRGLPKTFPPTTSAAGGGRYTDTGGGRYTETKNALASGPPVAPGGPVAPGEPVASGGPRTPGRGPCHFLLLARMDEWKGIDDLLAACRTLGERGVRFQLTLAGPPGTAGDAPTLQAKIRDHNLEGVVRYVGPVRGAAKSEVLRRADVYIQPSHHEGMPIALLEALAHGLPVVATRVGSVVEVITQRETGLLVPPRQPDRLAGAMHELASDPGLREAMSRAARALATRRFCTARLQRDLISLYDTVMSQHTRAASAPVPAKTKSRVPRPCGASRQAGLPVGD